MIQLQIPRNAGERMVEKHQVGCPYHSQARLKRHRALRPRRRRPRRNTTFLCILLPIKTTYPVRARPALQVPGQCVAGGCQMRCGSAKTNEPAPPDALYGRFASHVRTKMQTCHASAKDLQRYRSLTVTEDFIAITIFCDFLAISGYFR